MLAQSKMLSQKKYSNSANPLPPLPSHTPLPLLFPSSYALHPIAASSSLTCCSGCVLSTLFFATFFIMKFASISTSSTSCPPLTRHFPEIVRTPTGGLALTRESTPEVTLVRVSLYVV